MVLKVPKLTKPTLSVCLRPYSLLGFGDILVPGMQMNYGISLIIQAHIILMTLLIAH